MALRKTLQSHVIFRTNIGYDVRIYSNTNKNICLILPLRKALN